MNSKLFSIVIFVLVVLVGTIFVVKNKNGGEVMAESKSNKKVLVAYFSASGVTARVADRLSKAIGADIFEIKPAQVYTSADLDWTNKKSRSSVEMDDRNSRPEIANKVENMSQYDVIFVGFPIWWYREPSIIDTFMESYDFSGKQVIPFATSGGSGMGDSGSIMQKLAPNAKVDSGKRFSSGVSEKDLKDWAAKWL
jgi:flavodoxin